MNNNERCFNLKINVCLRRMYFFMDFYNDFIMIIIRYILNI